MKAASGDFQMLLITGTAEAINQSVVSSNAPRPPTVEITAERFRFADSDKWTALDIFD
jgi:hypothetical protein